MVTKHTVYLFDILISTKFQSDHLSVLDHIDIYSYENKNT